LSAAVYASSEGLTVLVLVVRSFGGQAGASSRIENYLGFPTGVSGQALAGRAYTQALKFGARFLIPAAVVRLDCNRVRPERTVQLRLEDGRLVRARAVVIATGARYRRPDSASLRQMEGRGVWYWASPIEAKMCIDEEVVVVGGGNSAGQAAVFLSQHARKVWMIFRSDGLAASMSRYLVDRISSTPNIDLLPRTEIVDVVGSHETGVTGVAWRTADCKPLETKRLRNVFLFLGADPCTDWLKGSDVALDEKGFVTTAHDAASPLQASVPGVFAIGDVRAGSVKRVGAAIGDGAAVVAQLHRVLENASQRGQSLP
ncbi:MAG: Cyclic nucleotide-regulated FAD-dependent pyridine nucleotide-disulfide oxidoreductase, partial [Ramlibacter sp.]|nr:Cyclic nucleotide-regulated FAD-dependent pyridine nucleotide-disulfide oxidoreductase [Ramlibacter sp.]